MSFLWNDSVFWLDRIYSKQVSVNMDDCPRSQRLFNKFRAIPTNVSAMFIPYVFGTPYKSTLREFGRCTAFNFVGFPMGTLDQQIFAPYYRREVGRDELSYEVFLSNALLLCS